MKNLNYTEKKFLIQQHMKQGLTFHEACLKIKEDKEMIKVVNSKIRKEKRDKKINGNELFRVKFEEMVDDE